MIQCNAMQYNAMWYNTMQCNATQHYEMQHNVMQCKSLFSINVIIHKHNLQAIRMITDRCDLNLHWCANIIALHEK